MSRPKHLKTHQWIALSRKGWTHAQIAAEYHCSTKSVQRHIKHYEQNPVQALMEAHQQALQEHVASAHILLKLDPELLAPTELTKAHITNQLNRDTKDLAHITSILNDVATANALQQTSDHLHQIADRTNNRKLHLKAAIALNKYVTALLKSSKRVDDFFDEALYASRKNQSEIMSTR